MSVVLDYTRGAEPAPDERPLMAQYLVSLKIVERLHRLLLDVVKNEFERVGRTMSMASRRFCSTISAIAS